MLLDDSHSNEINYFINQYVIEPDIYGLRWEFQDCATYTHVYDAIDSVACTMYVAECYAIGTHISISDAKSMEMDISNVRFSSACY